MQGLLKSKKKQTYYLFHLFKIKNKTTNFVSVCKLIERNEDDFLSFSTIDYTQEMVRFCIFEK